MIFQTKKIPCLVTNEDNLKLTTLPLAEEIKNAVFSLSGESTPSPDWYSGHFYQSYYTSIASNIVLKYQRGFITDSHIHDCIITSSKVVNLLHKQSAGNGIAFKINIKKVFDTVN